MQIGGKFTQNITKIRNFDELFSETLFRVARFPISSKAAKNTLLEDTNSGQGGASRLGSAYSTFQP